jgi:hypothetical protein
MILQTKQKGSRRLELVSSFLEPSRAFVSTSRDGSSPTPGLDSRRLVPITVLKATQLYRFLSDSTYRKVDQDLKWLPVLDKLELRAPHCDESNVSGLLPLADLETDTGVSK